MIRRLFLAGGTATVALLAAVSPRHAAAQTAKVGSGVAFDVAVTINVTGPMAGMLASLGPGYSGHGVAVGSRIRIDVADGALPPLAEKGDYLLFDSTSVTVVHPAKKEFVPISAEAGSKALEQIQALGMSIALKDIDVSLDTVPGADTLSGFKTRHYKTSIGYTVALEGFGTNQQLKSLATSEYWTAAIPGLSTSPLQRLGQLSSGQGLGLAKDGPLKDLAVKVDSIARAMKGTAVNVKTLTTSDMGGGANTIELGAQMLHVKQWSVDAALFVVPADYTRGASPTSGN